MLVLKHMLRCLNTSSENAQILVSDPLYLKADLHEGKVKVLAFWNLFLSEVAAGLEGWTLALPLSSSEIPPKVVESLNSPTSLVSLVCLLALDVLVSTLQSVIFLMDHLRSISKHTDSFPCQTGKIHNFLETTWPSAASLNLISYSFPLILSHISKTNSQSNSYGICPAVPSSLSVHIPDAFAVSLQFHPDLCSYISFPEGMSLPINIKYHSLHHCLCLSLLYSL